MNHSISVNLSLPARHVFFVGDSSSPRDPPEPNAAPPLALSHRSVAPPVRTVWRPQVKERVDAKNAFDGYIHSMRSATEGSGDNKGLSEKMDSVPLAG